MNELYHIGLEIGMLKARQSEQSKNLSSLDKRQSRVEMRQAILMRLTFLVIVFSLSTTGQLNRDKLAEFVAAALKKWLWML